MITLQDLCLGSYNRKITIEYYGIYCGFVGSVIKTLGQLKDAMDKREKINILNEDGEEKGYFYVSFSEQSDSFFTAWSRSYKNHSEFRIEQIMLGHSIDHSRYSRKYSRMEYSGHFQPAVIRRTQTYCRAICKAPEQTADKSVYMLYRKQAQYPVSRTTFKHTLPVPCAAAKGV